MTERGASEPGAGTGGAAVLSPQQQAQQDAFDLHRDQVRKLRESALAKRQTKDFSAAMTQLLRAADELCAQAQNLPVRMDQEAYELSRRLVRGSGFALLAMAGVLGLLVVLDVRSGWWWAGVLVLLAAGGVLLLSDVDARVGRHRRQRPPALIAVAGGVMSLIATFTPWWWAAIMLLLGTIFAALSTLETPTSMQAPGPTGSAGGSR